jgi:hypothetical protein
VFLFELETDFIGAGVGEIGDAGVSPRTNMMVA